MPLALVVEALVGSVMAWVMRMVTTEHANSASPRHSAMAELLTTVMMMARPVPRRRLKLVWRAHAVQHDGAVLAPLASEAIALAPLFPAKSVLALDACELIVEAQ